MPVFLHKYFITEDTKKVRQFSGTQNQFPPHDNIMLILGEHLNVPIRSCSKIGAPMFDLRFLNGTYMLLIQTSELGAI